jgi:hypothetical protein
MKPYLTLSKENLKMNARMLVETIKTHPVKTAVVVTVTAAVAALATYVVMAALNADPDGEEPQLESGAEESLPE